MDLIIAQTVPGSISKSGPRNPCPGADSSTWESGCRSNYVLCHGSLSWEPFDVEDAGYRFFCHQLRSESRL